MHAFVGLEILLVASSSCIYAVSRWRSTLAWRGAIGIVGHIWA